MKTKCICRNQFTTVGLLVLLALASLRAQYENTEIDARIEESLKDVISGMNQYSDVAGCMAKKLMEQRIVDRFYTTDLLTDPVKLGREVEPYLADAKSFCPNGVGTKIKNFFRKFF